MKKVIGWVLLLVGILMIFWGLYSFYEIFTAKKAPYRVFEMPKTQEVLTKPQPTGQDFQAQAQQQIQETLRQQFEKMLPPDSLVKLLNLISWSIFMAILVYGAGKIASLGIQLLRSNKIIKKK